MCRGEQRRRSDRHTLPSDQQTGWDLTDMTDKAQTLARAGLKGTIIHASTPALALIGLGFVAAAPWVATSLTDPSGALEPLGARLALAALIALTGLSMSVGMLAFQKMYVLRLVRERGLLLLEQTAYCALHAEAIDPAAIAAVSHHDWPTANGGSTPFFCIWVKGRRLPLIVDAHGAECDHDAIRQLAPAQRLSTLADMQRARTQHTAQAA